MAGQEYSLETQARFDATDLSQLHGRPYKWQRGLLTGQMVELGEEWQDEPVSPMSHIGDI